MDLCLRYFFFQFVAKFTRRFIADDESVSVITDIEDDDDGHGVASGLSSFLIKKN
jgi:hypothetical protein